MTQLLATIDVAGALNLAAGAAILFIGAGVALYERFSAVSMKLVLVTTALAIVLVSFGIAELGWSAEATLLWSRVGLATDAVLAAAVYALAVSLTGARRSRTLRLLWLVAAVTIAWTMYSPGLALGVLALGGGGVSAPGAWIGALFMAYMLAVLTGTIGELVRSHRRATHIDDRRRVLTIAAGFAVGTISLMDFVVVPRLFWGAGVTPLAATAAILIFGYAAVRFRAFAPLPAFAAERILGVMADGVLLCDADGTVRVANRAAASFLGVPAGELAGVPLTALFRAAPAEHHYGKAVAAADAQAVEFSPGRAILDRQLVLVARNGRTMDVSVSSEPLRQRGAAVGSVVVFRDIGERLRAARALRATEQRYHSLFWSNPALAYEVDRDGGIIEANPALERVLGLTAQELRQRTFAEFMHPDDLERAGEVFARALQGEGSEHRFRIITPRGATLLIKGVGIPIVRDGAVVGVFGVAIDITAEERVRRELEVQRLEFASLFEASPEAIVIADEHDAVIRVNAEFTRLFGYESEEAVGRHTDDLIVPPALRVEGAHLTGSARNGEVVRAETLRQRRDGSLVDVSLLARELRLPGRPPQLYGIYRDITAHKSAERSLRERDEELRHAQRLEAVGKLAGGVAHDFNNLITIINGHAGFALEAMRADDPVRTDLEEIQEAAARAASLTQQLLAFSRRQVLRPETVDAALVIADVRRMFGRLIGEHIHFETSHIGDARVRADRGQLEQQLVNLVMNARDAMPGGGRLTITTERVELAGGADGWDLPGGDYVRISVADTGVGMDRDTLARAFDPFFTTKEQGRGSGLGLATVFGIAKQSGGHVAASSVPGEGTTIDLWLPAAGPEVSMPTSDATAARPAVPAAPPSGVRILVVEDEAPLRELVARILRRAGHEVLLASDGVEGLAAVEAQPLDLVVSDLVMPRMGGRELTRRIRPFRPSLPILLMSGYDEEIARGSASERILAKPFTPADLVRRVGEALVTAPAERML